MPGERIFRPSRLVRMIAVLLVATAVFSLAEPAEAVTSHEQRMVTMINQARKARGFRALKLDGTLVYRARLHSKKMAAKGTIFHSNLYKTVSGLDWRIAGENVGMGPSMVSLHKAFMNSPPHRRNVLERRYRKLGVGVKWVDGTAFITIIFLA